MSSNSKLIKLLFQVGFIDLSFLKKLFLKERVSLRFHRQVISCGFPSLMKPGLRKCLECDSNKLIHEYETRTTQAIKIWMSFFWCFFQISSSEAFELQIVVTGDDNETDETMKYATLHLSKENSFRSSFGNETTNIWCSEYRTWINWIHIGAIWS